MRIATKLKIAVLVPALIAVVAVIAIAFQSRAIETAQQNRNKIRDILVNINSFNTLVYTYMLSHEERPKQQFLAEHEQLTRLLSQVRCSNKEQQQALDVLKNDLDSMEKLFVRMISNYERLQTAGQDPTVLEAGERLGGHLLATASETVNDGIALARLMTDRINFIQRMLNSFILILFLCVTLAMTFLLAGTMKTISASLTGLARGVERIGAGDLDHRLGMDENDEIGELARAFDRMAAQLSQSYSALRHSEERLRHSEETLRLAVEATRLGTFDFYPGTGELYWSDLAKRHFGLSPEAHVDYQVFLSGLHPEDRERVDGMVQNFLTADGGREYETEHRTIGIEDGQERWLAARGRAFFNDRGEPVRFIGATLDITERKRIQEQLQAMKDELEQKVEQRTRDLVETQKKFLHAEKLSAIGKLSASIAHEFNNPLQAIMTILQSLRKSEINGEDLQMLEMAIAECDRVKKLIRNLQNFYRPSSERKEFVDLHKILDSLLLLLKSDFKRNKIAVELNYAERLPLIFVVADQIKQVILNLLSNAADACSGDGGLIAVATRQEEEKVAITVRDTGVGIKPEEMEQIFRPFFTTKAKTKGTGLGLSVSYGIVKNHGGEILVESEPGRGSVFTVLLPVKESEKPEAENTVW